jgi:predicted nucleic acid-binding protein
VILVDTSVWFDHFRYGDARLVELLHDGSVACHPFIVGELACGSLSRRTETLGMLRRLPLLPPVAEFEAHALLEARRLHTNGIGWVDVHLLASALVAAVPLWTRDLDLARAARRVGLPAIAE